MTEADRITNAHRAGRTYYARGPQNAYERINQELREEGYGFYTADDLIDRFADAYDELEETDSYICIKIPSESEMYFRIEDVKELLGR